MKNDFINREALLSSISRKPYIVVNGFEYIRCETIQETVQKAPHIEAKPVVHATWEPDMYFDQPVMRCMECKVGFAEGHHAERFRFCPSCGAKMDAKDIDVPTKDGGAER